MSHRDGFRERRVVLLSYPKKRIVRAPTLLRTNGTSVRAPSTNHSHHPLPSRTSPSCADARALLPRKESWRLEKAHTTCMYTVLYHPSARSRRQCKCLSWRHCSQLFAPLASANHPYRFVIHTMCVLGTPCRKARNRKASQTTTTPHHPTNPRTSPNQPPHHNPSRKTSHTTAVQTSPSVITPIRTVRPHHPPAYRAPLSSTLATNPKKKASRVSCSCGDTGYSF